MGLNFSFFKTPRHRVFTYQPLYFDERKERMDQILSDIEKGKAIEDGLDWKNERYVPGRSIRGSIRSANEKNKRHAMKSSTRKLVTIVSLIALFIIMFYFAEYFSYFISSLF